MSIKTSLLILKALWQQKKDAAKSEDEPLLKEAVHVALS